MNERQAYCAVEPQIQPSSAPKTRLDHDDIEKAIRLVEYAKIGKKTTLCCITTTTGFEIVGTSSCVDGNNYSESTGRYYALEKAKQKLWELMGFELQSKLAA